MPTAYAADRYLVEDHAYVLTDDEWESLLERANAISEKYNFDVAIVTLSEMTDNDGAYEWARDIYEEFDYGTGREKSGLLFFISITERDFALVAYGYGHTAFTDYGKDVMLDNYILPLLRDDKFYEAFSVYLDKAEEFLQLALDGEPFDRGTDPSSQDDTFFLRLSAVIILPLLIAWIICSAWKKQMKTAVTAKTACNYIPPGGFRLTSQADMFLYRTQTKTKIEPRRSSSGGTRVDSRGFSGRSGKF
jgi:uncharacterized protein